MASPTVDKVVKGNLVMHDHSESDLGAVLDSRYLKLNGSNDPITGLLTLKQTTATDALLFQFDAFDPDSRMWNFGIGGSTNFSLPRKNTVMNYGYNSSAGGGSLDATDHSFYLQLESYFEMAGEAVCEYHLNYYPAGGGGGTRPFQINVGQTSGNITHWYTATSVLNTSPSGYTVSSLTLGTDALTSSYTVNAPMLIVSTDDVEELIVRGFVGQVNPIVQFQNGSANNLFSLLETGKISIAGQLYSGWTTTDTVDTQGIVLNWLINPPTAGGSYSAVYGAAITQGTSNIASIYGMNYNVSHQSSGVVAQMFGINASVQVSSGRTATAATGALVGVSSSGTSSFVYGLQIVNSINVSANLYQLDIPAPTATNVTSGYGIRLGNQQPTGVGTGIAIYTGAQSGWTLYSTGGQSMHAGNMKFGAVAVADRPVDITGATIVRGASDTTQFIVKGNAIQTTDLFDIQNSSATSYFKTNVNTGTTTIRGKSAVGTVGTDTVTNGNFATNATWTYGTGWAWNASGYATHTAGNTATLSQTLTLVNGGMYRVEFQIKAYTTGTITVTLNGTTNSLTYKSMDSFAPMLVAGASGGIVFTPSSDFDGSIDNVVIKLITKNTAAIVVMNEAGTITSEQRSLDAYNNGKNALQYLSLAGSGNVAIGGDALRWASDTYRNTAIGDSALASFTTGVAYNVAIGTLALGANEVGVQNTAIGYGALQVAQSTQNNVAIGAQTLNRYIGGNNDSNKGNNVAIGAQAMFNLTYGYQNVGFGTQSMFNATTAIGNVAIGANMPGLTTGGSNISLGIVANQNVSTGGSNTSIGVYAGYGIDTQSNNTNLGAFAGCGLSGAENVFIGASAGYLNFTVETGVNYNTVIGKQAGVNLVTGSSGNVFLGYKAGYNETGSNTLHIANSITSTPLIYGIFSGSTAGLTIYSQNLAGVPLSVQGIASQSADLQNWKNSTGTVLANITATGAISGKESFTITSATTPFLKLTDGYGTSQIYSNGGYLYVQSAIGTMILYDSIYSTKGASFKETLALSSNNVAAVSINTFNDVPYYYSGLNLVKARGTEASPADVQTGDYVGGLNLYGYKSASPQGVGGVTASVDDASGTYLTGKFTFAVNDGTSAGANFPVFSINKNGASFGTATFLSDTNFYFDIAQDKKKVVIRGHSTQTNNLTEWQNSSGTVLTKIDKDGKLTVPSYVRHTQLTARLTGNPANQPTDVDFFTVSGLQFATTGAKYAFCQWELPDDWDGTDVYFEVDWFPDSGAMAGTDTVEWTIEYACVAEGEIHGAGTSKTLTLTNSNDNARYFSIHSRGTMPYNDANQPLAKQDHIYFKISRNTAVANDFGGTVTVPAFEVIYNSNTLPTGN